MTIDSSNDKLCYSMNALCVAACCIVIIAGMYFCSIVCHTFMDKSCLDVPLDHGLSLPSIIAIGDNGFWELGADSSVSPSVKSETAELMAYDKRALPDFNTPAHKQSLIQLILDKSELVTLPAGFTLIARKRTATGTVITEIVSVPYSLSTVYNYLVKAGWVVKGDRFDLGIHCTLAGRSVNLWSPNPEADQPTLFITP